MVFNTLFVTQLAYAFVLIVLWEVDIIDANNLAQSLSSNPSLDPEMDTFLKNYSEKSLGKSAEGEKPECWLSEASKILIVGFLLFSTAVAMVLRAAHDAVYHVLTLPDDGDTAKVFVIWWLQYSWSPDTDLKVITAIARWFRDRYDL